MNSNSPRVNRPRRVVSPDQAEKPSEYLVNSKLNLGLFDIWALGITVVIGGQYISWNTGLSAGFGSYLISTVLMGVAYTCLCLCNAEITSALPFAGGAYGIARLSFGLYAGFIIGCLEAIEYIAYVASACIVLSALVCDTTGTSFDLIPMYSLIFYVVAVWIQVMGGRLFWRSSAVLGVVSIGILLVYNFGSLYWANIVNVSAPSTTGDSRGTYFIGGMRSFITVTPLAAWWFVGVESLNLSCSFVANPRVTVGRGSILCATTLFITSIFTVFVCSSLPPYNDKSSVLIALAIEPVPLNNGFMRIFSLSYKAVSSLSIPATFATAFGFVYGYGRVILSMSRSGLFPVCLTYTYGQYKTPYVAIAAGSVMSYGLVLIAFFVPIVQTYLFNVCILAGFTGYISQLIGFILFRIRFPEQERLYVSPLGVPGALFPIAVFGLSAVSVMGFQADNSIAFVIYLTVIVLSSIYYFSWAKSRQFFSVEEKFIYGLQIVKFNERNRNEVRTGSASIRTKRSNPRNFICATADLINFSVIRANSGSSKKYTNKLCCDGPGSRSPAVDRCFLSENSAKSLCEGKSSKSKNHSGSKLDCGDRMPPPFNKSASGTLVRNITEVHVEQTL